MKVAVMGAGAIGGYFGGMLARAGHDVTLIARGEHLRAILQDGLQMRTEAGDFSVRCGATQNPAEVGTVDLALLTTKTYHNVDSIPAMAPMIGSETAVLSLQNGIDSYLPVAERFPDAIVLPGAAYIEASRLGPGAVRQAGAVVRIVTGGMRDSDPGHGRRAAGICAAFRDAGVPAEASDDIDVTLWSKFLFIATMAGGNVAGPGVSGGAAAPTGMAQDCGGLYARDRGYGSGVRGGSGVRHCCQHPGIHGVIQRGDAGFDARGSGGRAAPGTGGIERRGGARRRAGGFADTDQRCDLRGAATLCDRVAIIRRSHQNGTVSMVGCPNRLILWR